MIKIKIALRVIALALLLTSLMIGLARSQAAPSSSTLSAEAANSGAFGPSVVTLRNLPSPSAPGPERLPPVPQNYSTPAQNPQASFQVRSEDKSVSANSIFGQADSNVQVASKLGPSFSNFTTYGTIDVNGSTNGTNIFANEGNSTLTVYSLSGSIIKQTFADTFWCSGVPQLPVCSTGGFAGDNRVIYDISDKHWTMSALWGFGSGANATVVMAVSRTADPTGAWSLYQFPACGAFDTWDGSDQPHIGFNKQWLVINSACSSQGGVEGVGLAVFDKSNLYRGNPVSLNSTWHEFTDPLNGTQDNPVLTYTPLAREYFTHADINSSGFATITYSYLDGATSTPAFHSATMTVTTSFRAGPAPNFLIPGVASPNCTSCMGSFSNGWIHSSGVWAFRNGGPRIVSTVVMGDPLYINATQVINTATNIGTSTAVSLQLTQNKDGSGPLAAEISMPGVRNSTDKAVIVYDDSGGDFYPGLKDVIWNMDNNTIISGAVLQQGSFTPDPGFDQSRWVDFIDAIAPVPGTSQIIAAGSVAAPSASNPQHSTYWALITP